MKYISLPTPHDERRLSFYLAMEEYVARHIDEPDSFFLWQVAPSVIFGRNQQLEREVNVDYCRRNGIAMYRRKSGGGCVYADWGNLMLSFVTCEENSQLAFHHFLNMVILVLRKLGIEAVSTVHNDVLIDGLKVSGTACYRLPERNIVHGTLLYDTNMEHMLGAITPSVEKLQQKGIESVRQRITLLKNHTTVDIDYLKNFIRTTLCTTEHPLTMADVAVIEAMEQEYLSTAFIERM